MTLTFSELCHCATTQSSSFHYRVNELCVTTVRITIVKFCVLLGGPEHSTTLFSLLILTCVKFRKSEPTDVKRHRYSAQQAVNAIMVRMHE